ncbi:GAF domain-containing protein [Nodularia spumigena CS-586/05]|uniref:GAF domain-containing protein n=1 Tax=Nodularia spumigena TaxID=70799 RepID=UPI00232E9ECF|nr:GAF domain-containing protein [Nodularia spumigena]MDB9344591.1 GAF domain-containing protein [Nodularia spumigena CS-588/06]MDB9368937.1 GAF domain-containing protein [Nodularia spumigena CS-586/05]
MTNLALPETIQTILDKNTEPDSIFSAILPAIGEALQCDRCFLYLRNPQTQFGKIAYWWRRNHDIPEIKDSEWKLEPASLPQEDPLFAAALRTEASIYIEDVETASPTVVNKEFERQNFGHRALIHAHLCQDGQLWGILQPCVFSQKRVWSHFDHTIITQLERELTPLAVTYITPENLS